MKDLLYRLSDLYEDEFDFKSINLSNLLGEILINRIGGLAYYNLEKKKQLSSLPREFKETLRLVHRAYIQKYYDMEKGMKYLSGILQETKIPYAFLKGAYLSMTIYPKGTRVSNDYDILISQRSISDFQELLFDNGFRQGRYSETYGFQEASRTDVLRARMNYGETVGFVKIIEDKPIEVDINISVDYKAKQNSDIVEALLDNVEMVSIEPNFSFSTLSYEDFLIHLCCHLYKEATTYNWIEAQADLALYKFADINMMIHQTDFRNNYGRIINRIYKLGVERECYFTLENASLIYPDLNKVNGYVEVRDSIKPSDLTFMNQVIWPYAKKRFEYRMDFLSWMECDDRVNNLFEV